MGSIVKRRGKWRALVARMDVRASATFQTRQEAADWIAARESEILSGKALPGRQTFNQAAERWSANRTITRSEATRLRAFSRLEWASKPLRELTSETLVEWRDDRLKAVMKSGRTVASSTVAREMATLRSVLQYARKDLKWIAASPLHEVATPPEPPPRRRPITDAELAKMLGTLGYSGSVTNVRHEVAVALLLALETAMRAGELLGLRWDRIKGTVAHLPRTKNGDARDVPLSTGALALLKIMRRRRLDHVRVLRDDGRVFHIDSGTLDTLFRRAREESELSGFTFHDSRATALTRLAKILTPLELARMVGHRDLNSLLLYYGEPASAIAAKLG